MPKESGEHVGWDSWATSKHGKANSPLNIWTKTTATSTGMGPPLLARLKLFDLTKFIDILADWSVYQEPRYRRILTYSIFLKES